MYAVFREGIYRHACAGIFTHRKTAIEVADKLKAQERDDYHAFTVVPFTIDVATKCSRQPVSKGELQERDAVYCTGGRHASNKPARPKKGVLSLPG